MPRIHLGDKGTTQINKAPNRASKGSSLIYFYSQIDILNAHLNICLNLTKNQNKNTKVKKQTISLIKQTIEILKILIKINSSIVASFFCLQNRIDKKLLNKMLNTAKQLEDKYVAHDFIWIYSNKLASYINLARTYARATENAYYQIKNNPLIKNSVDDTDIKAFLNRQSTILFHLAVGLENQADK